jgi:hypothetical protein
MAERDAATPCKCPLWVKSGQQTHVANPEMSALHPKADMPLLPPPKSRRAKLEGFFGEINRIAGTLEAERLMYKKNGWLQAVG